MVTGTVLPSPVVSGPLITRYAGPAASSLSGPVIGPDVTRTVVGPSVLDSLAPSAPIVPVASVYGTPGLYI